jgi:hypothetical protein
MSRYLNQNRWLVWLEHNTLSGNLSNEALRHCTDVRGFCKFANATAVPEIDPGSAGSALALLSGALLVIRSQRKK